MTPTQTPERRPFVLYAENDENDAFLMNVCWKRAAMECPLRVVNDGQEAIDYLAGSGAYADREQNPLPTLLLLDLSMPRRSGLDVLRWARANPAFAELPVLIVSSSNQEKDRAAAAALGVSGYFVKPAGMAGFVEMLRGWRERWLA